MSTRKIELSVGAVKYVEPNEIITEEEYNYIKNKVPELNGRVDIVEDEIEEINSSLETIANNENDIPLNLENKRLYNNGKNSNVTFKTKSIPNNVSIDNLNIYNNETTETLVPSSTSSNIEIKNVKADVNNMFLHIARNGVKNIVLKDSVIIGGNFPILVNESSKGGENLNIINNNITSKTGDGIEINTPNQGVDTFRGVKIIGNTIESVVNGDVTHTSGFGVGIAQGQDIIVSNNIIKDSRNEALHVEDCTENLIVTNNVFNTSFDGAWLHMGDRTKTLPEYVPSVSGLYAKTYLINSNHFKRKNNTKTNKGIYIVYDQWGDTFIFNIANNRIEGFDYGIYSNGIPYLICDNTVIENCNIGLRADRGKYIGKLIMKNCDKLVEVVGECEIDEIISYSKVSPSNLIINNITTVADYTTINKLTYPQIHYISLDDNLKTQIKLLPISKVLNGKLFVKVLHTGNKKEILFDITYDGTSLTSNKLTEVTYGSFGDATLILKDGFISLDIYASGWNNYNITVETSFNGKYIFGK